MELLVIAAGWMALVHLMAACRRPRAAVIVSGILWLLYAAYEYQVATGVLCDSDCNIRVDLVFLFPILALATFCAYESYEGRPGQMMVIATVLGVIGLIISALLLEHHGYAVLSGLAIAAALAISVYAINSKPRPDRS